MGGGEQEKSYTEYKSRQNANIRDHATYWSVSALNNSLNVLGTQSWQADVEHLPCLAACFA